MLRHFCRECFDSISHLHKFSLHELQAAPYHQDRGRHSAELHELVVVGNHS